MAYDFYNAAKSINQATLPELTPASKFRWELQQFINSDFDIASDYYVIQKQNRTTKQWYNIGVRLTFPYSLKEQSTLRDDFRRIIFKDNSDQPKLGDLFKFNDYVYMCTDTGTIESATVSCVVQRCNVELKFTESSTPTATVISIYGISSRYYIDSLNKNQFITLPDNQVEVYIPNDSDGRKIVYSTQGGTRFLIGNPLRNWVTISIDNMSKVRPTAEDTPDDSNGIIMLKLELGEINTGYDDLVNGIAWQDYF